MRGVFSDPFWLVSVPFGKQTCLFLFLESHFFYTVMINLGVSPLKGNNYRWHESQFALTYTLSKCKYVTLLWSRSVNIAAVYYRTVLHLDPWTLKGKCKKRPVVLVTWMLVKEHKYFQLICLPFVALQETDEGLRPHCGVCKVHWMWGQNSWAWKYFFAVATWQVV